MRYLVLFALIIALASCTAPPLYPTPTPTATLTPTPRPAGTSSTYRGWSINSGPTVQVARAVAERFKHKLDATYEDIPILETSKRVGNNFVAVMCEIADGVYSPDVRLSDLSDDERMRLTIRDYCDDYDGGYLYISRDGP